MYNVASTTKFGQQLSCTGIRGYYMEENFVLKILEWEVTENY